MSRYIDADALKKRVSELIVPDWTRTLIRSWLDSEPTVDAVPVKFIYESADLLRKCADEHGARVLYMLIENWNRADGERKDGEHDNQRM